MKPEDASRLVHAYLDSELDAAASAEFEQLLETSAPLRAEYQRQRALSAAVHEGADYHVAPPALVSRLRNTIAEPPAARGAAGRPGRWAGLGAAFAAVAFAVWGVTYYLTRPDETSSLAQQVLTAHLRASLGKHLTEIASSDQHTVKPWLSARLDFSPPTPDLSVEGFELAGGRLDYVDARAVAVLVYRRRLHVIDVFVWPASRAQSAAVLARNGFNVEHFAAGGMQFWLVSDLNRRELGDLARLLAKANGES